MPPSPSSWLQRNAASGMAVPRIHPIATDHMAKTNPLNDKLVVLIGGTGFLGTHVAQSLLARGARLRIASTRGRGTTVSLHVPLGQLVTHR